MRKLGKKSTLKRYYQQASEAQLVNTNLEKNTQEKIHTMTNNDALTMDFVLKNRKLLEHLKKCKVFLSKSMRKNLLKKYALLNNPIRKINHGKASNTTKVKRGRSSEDHILNIPLLNGVTVKEEADSTCASPPNLRPNRVIMATPKTPKLAKNDLPPQTSKPAKQNVLPAGRNAPSPGPIFIRLPPKTNKRTIQKRQIYAKSIDKSNLIRRFGKMVFKCHVRVKRLKKTDPIFTKKFKTNRKTVSFMETVEVFGESDVEFASDQSMEVTQSSFTKIAHTSSPFQGKKTKRNKLKSPKVQNRRQLKEINEIQSKNKQKKKAKQNTQSSEKVKSPAKVNSPQKKTSSPAKKTLQQNRGSPKKQKNPKKQQQTDITRLNLIEGKECYVKLNRSSRSLLSLSMSSENGEIEENNAEPTSLDTTGITEATTEPNQNEGEKEIETSEVLNGSSANGDVTNHIDDTEEDVVQNEQNDIDGKAKDENNLEPVRLENDGEEEVAHKGNTESNIENNDDNDNIAQTDDVATMEKSNSDKGVVNLGDDDIETNKEDDNTNKDDRIINEDDNAPMYVEDSEERDIEKGNNLESDNNPEDSKNVKEDGGDEDKINDKKIEDSSNDTSPSDQLNGKNTDKNSRTISARKNISSIEESKSEQDGKVSERKLSTPVHRRGKFDKIDRSEARSVSASPVLSGSKTNGTKRKSDTTATEKSLPESSEDLFDLLKSNKLPEKVQSSNRVPSPLPELSDDETEPTSKLNKHSASPVIDLAEDSNSSANDSRFSLNTFFKSSNRTGNESPGKSPPSTDEINLKNPDSNIDSPKPQEITTQ